MPLEIKTLITGPIQTNTYLIADTNTKQAVVIDPAGDSEVIIKTAEECNWQITQIWLTHAHFDHFAGAAAVAGAFKPAIPLAIHPDDLDLLHTGGGADFFFIPVDPAPEPTIWLQDKQNLTLGGTIIQVIHAPGHTPGHVVYYCAEAKTLFGGDVLFFGSVGRTDLPGGNHRQLIASIHLKIMALPDDTLVLTGHGPGTSIGFERTNNPFL